MKISGNAPRIVNPRMRPHKVFYTNVCLCRECMFACNMYVLRDDVCHPGDCMITCCMYVQQPEYVCTPGKCMFARHMYVCLDYVCSPGECMLTPSMYVLAGMYVLVTMPQWNLMRHLDQ